MNEAGMIGATNEPMRIEDIIVEDAAVERMDDPQTGRMEESSVGRDVLLRTMAITAASLGTIAIASSLTRRSPWAGVNAIATGLGLATRRPAARFRPMASGASLAATIGGAAVIALVDRAVSRRTHAGPIARGALAAATGVAIDMLVMRRGMFHALRRSLGTRGVVAKYAAMGIAAGIATRAGV